MNSDDFASPVSPTSPSASNSAGRRIRVRSLKRSLTGQEASLPSIPSDDNDWVSPFTLPPLPALRKNRTHLDRSPEDRQHDRAGSSAYYAAAWGSPYATPSPNQSPASRLNRNKSLDLHSSPLVSRSVSRYATPGSASVRDQATTDKDRSTSLSPIDSQEKSQRRNWLSESDESASDNDQRSRKTPRQRKHTADNSGPSDVRSHNVKESVDTITPETFNGTSGMTTHPESPSVTHAMAESQSTAAPPISDETLIKEKPLPNLPTSSSVMQQNSPVQSRPPLSMPTQSFQRPKKKVPWKGKSCIIAMPLTDREQAGLQPVMSPQAIRDRIQMWIDLGYPVHGFNVGDWYSSRGASRPTFPDFADMDFERKNTGPSVRIPNQRDWEDFVEYLKEEKLRALGVTPSTSEAPPSTHSPFSSTISRVSSAYPSVSASPPIPPLSVASSHPRMGHSPFSPSMSIPAHSNYFGASNRGTPGLPNGSRPMHGYTQSIAIPGMGQRINSPFEYPISQPYGSGMRSPADQIGGRRSFTPGHVQNMQSMGHILSPVNLPQQDFARSFSPTNPQIEQIRRQQEALARHQQHVQAQIVRAQHQRQMSMFPLRAMSTEQLPVTPKIASPEREPPEIMHPTPRSHRHNLSAALEKGVTESVAASSKDLSQVLNGGRSETKSSKHNKEEVEEGEIVEEEEEEEEAAEELPILHRPETIKDADEKAEVETNPSIAGTPLLLDDQNPFSSFKPLPPPEAVKHPGFGHAAQPSLSRFNVQAKEFSPSKSTFTPNPFNFDGNAFADRAKAPEKQISHAAKFSHKHNPSSLGLNVTAPVFTPVFTSIPAQPDQLINATSTSNSQHATPAKSSFDANLKSSVFSSNAAEKPEFSTPAKTSFNPTSAAFNFTGGSQREETPAKAEAEPQSSAFSFRSANFNVEAPEFKPLGLSLSSIDFTPEKPKDFTNGTIFSDVVLDPSSKPNRRIKALPIVKPESREATPVLAEKEEFDAEDRLMAPSDRNKRARHIGGDDEKILFADSAPFNSLGLEGEETDDVQNVSSERAGDEQPAVEVPKSTPAEPATTMTKLDTVIEEQSATPPALDITQEQPELKTADPKVEDVNNATSPVKVDAEVVPSHPAEITLRGAEEEDDKQPDIAEQVAKDSELANSVPVVQNNAAAEDTERVTPTSEQEVKMPEVIAEGQAQVMDTVQPTESADDLAQSAPAHAPAPTLSAAAPAFKPIQSIAADSKPALSPFAQPFEFHPAVKDFTPAPAQEPKPRTPEVKSHDESVKPKKGGLLASKFASSPPPAPAVPVVDNAPERHISPPREVAAMPQSNIQPAKDTPSEIEAVPLALGQEEIEEPEQHASFTDPASILARFREEDSRAGSVMSRPGDLSYEEINAVMKQFEDDPDLGVIREDTPVKSTPLIDMRYPQNFRSDAPSPSPRRLDQPFNRNRDRPYGGLGFDISGVHQLNYGTPQIDDWNADLSPGQQDKLEARAHFFDDHVNDLVDNVLESRLAPLERTLQSIQHSVQQVTTKPRSSRRSMSTENKDSDADDEDDYDAYEGYSHYRSKSPHKRDRRSDKIKSAVIEAMALAQPNIQPANFDTSSIETALQELRELTQKSVEQPREPVVDLSEIRQALSELREHSQREVPAPVIDTTEFSKYIEEMKTLNQQRGSERQANFLAMQTTLNELRNLASEKPAPTVVDLSSLHSALAELQQQAQKQPVVPEVDLTMVHEVLAELRQQASEKPVAPVVDLSSIHRELAELRKEAAERPTAPEIDLSAIHLSLAELKQQTQVRSLEAPSEDLRSMFENIISTHPRLATRDVEQDNEPLRKLQAEVDRLNNSLKNAERRADGEASLRREAEEEQDTLHRRLKDAQDQVVSLKASSEAAKMNLQAAVQDREGTRGLSNEVRDLKLKNEALEKTLDEYRLYKEELLKGLDKERNRTDGLERQLQTARHQHTEYAESRDSLREQLGQLQQRMSKVVEDVHHDEAEWRKREHDLASKNQLLQAALDHETNRRARSELESERLNKEHRESLQHKSKHEVAQEEMSRLASIIVGLQAENKNHQDTAFSAQRELKFLQEKTEETVTSKVNRLQDELQASRAMYETLQSDSDARIARLEGQLANAAVDFEAQKQKHEQNMEKMFDNHNRAVRDVEQRCAADLEQRLAFHEEKLVALRAQHTRDVDLAAENKKHVEQRYQDKLEMSNDKIGHLESKVNDLQESLAVTKSAARAAVEAATMKGVNLPTPASSVMASPPHRGSISSASMPIARGSDLPEKISPQALRETIMVLQDQLQNREQKIDKLEAELAAIDKEAPAKVKERDTEIVMLRELLEVRVDDLQELIGTLEKPGYDQTAVKDAAIRLKTQIKMEQQLKERMITGAGLASSLPASIGSGLANLTQSPRAMVAAAAWGNWRKVRDSGIGAVSDFANNLGAQTPSRVSSAPSTALNDMMSSPGTKAKLPSNRSQLPPTRPLAAAAGKNAGPASPSGGARPLRAFNSQPRTLSGARPLARRGTNESRPGSSGSVIRTLEPSSTIVEPPSTPKMKAESDFGDDVDDDASPLDGKTPDMDSDLEELVRSEQNAMKARSPKTSRIPRSPRTSRSFADGTRKEIVEVIEES